MDPKYLHYNGKEYENDMKIDLVSLNEELTLTPKSRPKQCPKLI